MTPVVRRAAVFWFLLLVPTLATGGGALWLLSREQARWEEQAKAAMDSRRSSLEARARLIVENVELILGDVQTALMETLQSAPTASVSTMTFLEEWMRSNSLVRQAFRIGPDQRIIYPAGVGEGVTRDWVEALVSSPPWTALDKTEAQEESLSSREVRKSVSSNVANAQAARSAVQDLAMQRQRSESDVVMQKSIDNRGQNGWTPIRDGSQRIHLLGWRKLADGAVLGVEINLEELSRRWVNLLPDRTAEREHFEIQRDPGMSPLNRALSSISGYSSSPGKRGATSPEVSVPLSERILPGWAVVGYLDEDAQMTSARGFILAGTLLVMMLIVSILIGGTLLVRQARRSEEDALQKTSFVANVSHEFRTPLTTIRLYAELLAQDRVRSQEQKTNYLRVIGEESERMTRLVNNALDFSRLEQGKKKYALEALDLVPEFHRMLDLLEPRVAAAGLVLQRDLPSSPVVKTVDRDAVQQILSNLVENACKYAPEGEIVTVGLTIRENDVHLVVEDRGPGIALEHRRRIFEKFHRVDETLTAEKSGVGLGLSIARQLARGLGGDLQYEARDGGGARFIVTFV